MLSPLNPPKNQQKTCFRRGLFFGCPAALLQELSTLQIPRQRFLVRSTGCHVLRRSSASEKAPSELLQSFACSTPDITCDLEKGVFLTFPSSWSPFFGNPRTVHSFVPYRSNKNNLIPFISLGKRNAAWLKLWIWSSCGSLPGGFRLESAGLK